MSNSNSTEHQKDLVVEVRHVTEKAKSTGKSLNSESVLKLFELLPKIGWLLFAVIAFIFLFPIIEKKLSQAEKISAFGIEIAVKNSITEYNSKLPDLIQTIKESGDPKDVRKYMFFFQSQVSQIIRRVTLLQNMLDSTHLRILWVDDNPVNNQSIEEIFEKMGFNIDNASTTNSAIDLIRYGNQYSSNSNSEKYGLVITDFSRTNATDSNGIVMADLIKQLDYNIPIIMFSASFDETKGVPPSIYSVAHRADYLINYVLDVIERGGTPYPR